MAKQELIFKIDNAFKEREHIVSKVELPLSVKKNLKQDFEIRAYQNEALKRLVYYMEKDEDGLLFPEKSNHLAFNMATGSGKTLIMAGIILYMYERGFRNFLFFSTARQIIEKTRDNFLDKSSRKYLFNTDIVINNKKVYVKEVENFEKSSEEDINICFTTINGLHSKMQNVGENQITFEDFKNYKTVIIGDEAHHFNVNTKQKSEQDLWNTKNWENTINDILKANSENMFFELSATFEFDNAAIYKKYKDKVIYKYDIKEFRNDGFSKEILVLQSDVEKKNLIIQAIVFNQYKQEIAMRNQLDIKPVILFKSNRSIKESFANQDMFNELLYNLSADDIKEIEREVLKSDSVRLKDAFNYFKEKKDNYRYLIDILKWNFGRTKQLNVNESESQKELEEVRNQEELLNSLEDDNNQIRVIFAVNKLNEGWDVLNLFDIVRLYDEEIHLTKTKDVTKKQTVSEAQLIGRGARYCPFVVKDDNDEEVVYSNLDKYRRKFDKPKDTDELRILEELYYHSVYNSSFIASLHEELINQGWEDSPNDYEEKEISIKTQIAVTDFWRKEIVLSNKKIKKRYDRFNLWDRLPYGENKRNFEYKIPSGVIFDEVMLDKREIDREALSTSLIDIKLSDLSMNLKLNAMLYNNFYDFHNLKQKFPRIKSTKEFVKNYLDTLDISFFGDNSDLLAVKAYDKSIRNGEDFFIENEVDSVKVFKNIQTEIFRALRYLLNDIEKKLDRYTTLYQGTEYFKEKELLKGLFTNKTLKIKKDDNRIKDNKDLVEGKEWFPYNSLHGTSEEIAFVKFFDHKIYSYLKEKGYSDIYLVRNEEVYKIYNFDDGEGFCPDFLLFLRDKNKKTVKYQVLIEPKGAHIELKDDWKNNMLKSIKERFVENKPITFEFGEQLYEIIGIPFYNSKEENRFEKDFKECFQ